MQFFSVLKATGKCIFQVAGSSGIAGNLEQDKMLNHILA